MSNHLGTPPFGVFPARVGVAAPPQHLLQDQLDAYVIGALDDVEMAHVEAHVIECAACTARLQHEARLEMVLEAVALAPIKPKPVRVIGASAVAGGAIAMAAAMLLWLAPHGESAERSPSVYEEPVPASVEANRDASTFIVSLDLQADGSRLGIHD